MNATESSNCKKNTENDTSGSLPCQKNRSGESHQDSNKHSYFVPVMLMIVLGIIVISTFFDKEFSSPVATQIPQGQHNSATSNHTQTLDPGGDTGDQAEISAPASTHDGISATASASVVDNASPKTTSTITRATYATRQTNFAFPYMPQIPHATATDRIHSHYKMMQARRKAYEQATQAKIEHRHKMREYRLIVMKRIQLDRKDLHRRRHSASQHRHDDAFNSVDQIQDSIPYHPT